MEQRAPPPPANARHIRRRVPSRRTRRRADMANTRARTLGENLTQRFCYFAAARIVHLDSDRDPRGSEIVPEPWEHAAVEDEFYGVSRYDRSAGEKRDNHRKVVLVRP